MTTDRGVTSRMILQSMAQLERRGRQIVLEELEQVEPELVEFLLENLSRIYQRLLETGAKPKRVQRLNRRIETLVLTVVLAIRTAHLELWRKDMGGHLDDLNPETGDDPPPSPPNSSGESPP